MCSLPKVIDTGVVNKVIQLFGASCLLGGGRRSKQRFVLPCPFISYSFKRSYSCPSQFLFISYALLIHLLCTSHAFRIRFLFTSYNSPPYPFPIHFAFTSYSSAIPLLFLLQLFKKGTNRVLVNKDLVLADVLV